MYENTLSGLIYNHKALEVVLKIKGFACLTQIMLDLFPFYPLPKNSTFQPLSRPAGKRAQGVWHGGSQWQIQSSVHVLPSHCL